MKLSQIYAIAAVVNVSMVAISGNALGQPTEVRALNFAKEYSVHSEILNEDRTFWVSLPTSYENPIFGPEHYPVIYAVDGISVFFPPGWFGEFYERVGERELSNPRSHCGRYSNSRPYT